MRDRRPSAIREGLLVALLALAAGSLLGSEPARAVCGDGLLEAGEVCDDGNLQPGDCCDASCMPEVGPGTPPCCTASGQCNAGADCGALCFMNGATCKSGVDAGGNGVCSCDLDPCPLGSGEYTLTPQAGGTIEVAGLAPFAFPTGDSIVVDVGAPDAACVHPVVVPPGVFAPTPFCIAGSFTVAITQAGCGVGIIDSDGGGDVTLNEIGDTSSATCGTPQACSTGVDDAIRVDVSVGDGSVDGCATGTGNAVVSILITTTVLSESLGDGCPGNGLADKPGELVLAVLSQVLDFTTDTATASFADLPGDVDGCFLAGLGPLSYSGAGSCLDLPSRSVTTVAAGSVGSAGAPLFDSAFLAVVPSRFEASDSFQGTTCGTPPVIPLGGGTATRCLP